MLLADGRVIADGPAAELLAGGWYFATETARILGGAGGALLPEQGARLLAGRPTQVSAPDRAAPAPALATAVGDGGDASLQGAAIVPRVAR